LDLVRELAEKLHTQAHEAANRLHTVVTLVQLKKYRQAIDFGTATLTGIQHLAENLLATIDEPALAALLLSKAAQANERGLDFTVTSDTSFRSFDIDTIDLITLVGNLLDNAIDAAQTTASGNGQVSITIRADLRTCFVRVTDTGPGLRPEQEDKAFSWGWTTKRAADGQSAGRGIGLTLVWQVVHRHRGTITVDSENSTVFTVRLFAPSRAPAFASPSRPGTVDAPVPLEPA
jgi:two-component system CitB family sensor kinase